MWLARAFTAGRRLCVWAPGMPDHAHHVVVEFVHPVVAGTRPLAAVVAMPEAASATSTDVRLVIGEAGASMAPAADLFISADQSDTAIVLSYHLLWELVQVRAGASRPGRQRRRRGRGLHRVPVPVPRRSRG